MKVIQLVRTKASCLPSCMRKQHRDMQTTDQASEPLGRLVKTEIAGPIPRVSDLVGLKRGSIIRIF